MLTIDVPVRFVINFDHSEGDGPTAENLTAQQRADIEQGIQRLLFELIDENFDAIVDEVSDESGFLVTSIVAEEGVAQ